QVAFGGTDWSKLDPSVPISRQEAIETFYCKESEQKPTVTPIRFTKLYPVCNWLLDCEPSKKSRAQTPINILTACRAYDDGSCPKTEADCAARGNGAVPKVSLVAEAELAPENIKNNGSGTD